MTAVGFEPTRIAPPELESGALDRSAKLSARQATYGIASHDVSASRHEVAVDFFWY